MEVEDVINLLEKNWPNIKEKLGENWPNFVAKYQCIINRIPDEPSREYLELTADEVCELMEKFDYTHLLLQEWNKLIVERVRVLISSDQVLNNAETVRQVCNRFLQLAKEFADVNLQENGKSKDIEKNKGYKKDE